MRVIYCSLHTCLMLPLIQNLCIKRQYIILLTCLDDLHARDLLGESSLILTVLYLWRVLDLLEQSCLSHSLVDTDCWRWEKQDEPVETRWVLDLHNLLGWGWRIESCLWISMCCSDIPDKCTVVITQRCCEWDFTSILIGQVPKSWHDLLHSTLSAHVVL